MKLVDKKNFKEYLEASRLEANFDFFSDGTIALHWTNCLELREHYKERYQSGDDSLLSPIDHELEALKTEIIWLRNRRGTLKMSMHDLYHAYSDPLLAPLLFKQEGEEQYCYSSGTEAGPFLSLAGLSWMNPRLYRQFVYSKILKGQLGSRDFRLNVDLCVDFSLVSRPLDISRMRLTQVTSHGLLFELPAGYRMMSHKGIVDEQIELYLPKGFNLGQQCGNLKNFSQSLKQHTLRMRDSSSLIAFVHYDFNQQLQKQFLYLRYDDFKGAEAQDFVAFFQKLLGVAKQETETLLEQVA